MLPVIHCLKIVVSKILSRLWQKDESNPYYSWLEVEVQLPFSNLHKGSLLVSETLIVLITPQGLCTSCCICLEHCSP